MSNKHSTKDSEYSTSAATGYSHQRSRMSRSRSRERSRGYSRSRSRSSSRSRTPSHRRSRHRSYDSYSSKSDYSDSFYSDGGSSPAKPGKGHDKKGQSSKSGAANKGKKASGRVSKGQKSPRGGITDTVTKRMLSARRTRINELKNQSEELANLVNELKVENKALKRQQKLQDRALDKYEGQENDMSAILDRHNNELTAAKLQTKRYRDKLQKTDKKLRETEFELDRTKKLVKKLRDLVDDRQLQERDDLSRKLSKAEADLDKKTQRVQDLERHVEHLKKNHRHEFGIERAREKGSQKQLEMFREEHERLKSALREKEKELEVANIYRFRSMKPPHRLNSSVRSSPVPNGMSYTCYTRQRKNSDSSILTARERAKQYEKQRYQKKKSQPAASRQADGQAVSEEPPPQSHADTRSPTHPSPHHSSRIQFSFSSHKSQQHTHDSSDERDDMHPPPNAHMNEQHMSYEPQYAQRETKPPYQPRPPLKPVHRAPTPVQEQPSPVIPPEAKARPPPPKSRSPSPQLPILTDKPASPPNRGNQGDVREGRRTKSPVLLDMGSQPPAREKSPITKTEPVTRTQPVKDPPKEDKWNFTTETSTPSDSPLPWLKPKSEPHHVPTPPAQDSDDESKRKKKEQLLARLRVIDEQKSQADKEKAKYSVSKPVENMHHGLPAYDNVTVPVLEREKRRKSLASDSDSDTGYKPSFLRNTQKPPTSKTQVTPVKSKAKNDDVTWLTGGGGSTNGFVRPARESSSAALAGGAAFFEDEAPPQSNRHLLPRRTRQPAQVISTKPSYNAVDSLDDDLEEVLI